MASGGGGESAGVRKPEDKGAAQHVDFAVDRGWSVTDGMELSIELQLVMIKL